MAQLSQPHTSSPDMYQAGQLHSTHHPPPPLSSSFTSPLSFHFATNRTPSRNLSAFKYHSFTTSPTSASIQTCHPFAVFCPSAARSSQLRLPSSRNRLHPSPSPSPWTTLHHVQLTVPSPATPKSCNQAAALLLLEGSSSSLNSGTQTHLLDLQTVGLYTDYGSFSRSYLPNKA